MNYRHGFHAGNHADVLKHITLLALIDALKRKDTPFFVLDSHAGRGRYPFAGEQSRRTGEAEQGVLRLMTQPRLPDVIERYLRAIHDHNRAAEPAQTASGVHLSHYPGSPLLAAAASRAQDRLAFCELQTEEATALQALFASDRRVRVHAGDGYAALRALLPPRDGATRIGRGLVLIDPPYEAQDGEYPLIIDGLRQILTRWPQASCAVWYPIKQRRSLAPFLRKAAALPTKSLLLAELLVRADDSPLRLNGSGMLLINPPWQFDKVLAPALPALKTHLGEAGAGTRLEWLKAPH